MPGRNPSEASAQVQFIELVRKAQARDQRETKIITPLVLRKKPSGESSKRPKKP